jgi:hypothetical protein
MAVVRYCRNAGSLNCFSAGQLGRKHCIRRICSPDTHSMLWMHASFTLIPHASARFQNISFVNPHAGQFFIHVSEALLKSKFEDLNKDLPGGCKKWVLWNSRRKLYGPHPVMYLIVTRIWTVDTTRTIFSKWRQNRRCRVSYSFIISRCMLHVSTSFFLFA